LLSPADGTRNAGLGRRAILPPRGPRGGTREPARC